MHGPRNISNLALVGFMGTGKSSVGRLLAIQLGFEFVDTDELIESTLGRSVSQIFAEEGEAKFREFERTVVAELAKRHNTVISTGGGLVLNPDNLVSLKQHALVVCLWAGPEVIWERVRHQTHRPLLMEADPLSKIRRLLDERTPCYRAADILASTERRTIRDVVQHVLLQFRDAQATRT